MQSKITKLFPVILLLLLCQGLSAQTAILEIAKDVKYPPEDVLSLEDRGRLIEAIELRLNQYAEAATLLDKSSRRVNTESIKRFQSLFTSTALLPKDFEEYESGSPIRLDDYCKLVNSRLGRHGIKVKIEKATLTEVANNSEDYLVFDLEVEKRIYNYVNSEYVVREVPSGRIKRQTIRFDVPMSDFKKSLINSIQSMSNSKEPADYVRYWGPSIGLVQSFFSPAYSALWTSSHAGASSMETSGKLGFYGGIDFMSNGLSPRPSPTKKIFLTAGLHVGNLRLTNRLSDFSISDFDWEAEDRDGDKQDYIRSVSSLQATESINLWLLQLSAGAAWQVVKKIRKYEGFIHVALLPSFAISSSTALDEGRGTYDAKLFNWRALEEGATSIEDLDKEEGFEPYLTGERDIEDNIASVASTSFQMAVRLSPVFYYHLSDRKSGWSLFLAMDLTYHPASYLKHENAVDNMLRVPNEYERSILQHYSSGMSAFSTGFRVGLHHWLKKKP